MVNLIFKPAILALLTKCNKISYPTKITCQIYGNLAIIFLLKYSIFMVFSQNHKTLGIDRINKDMLRIALFLLTNLAVIIVASITLSLLGVGSYLQEGGTGLDLGNLLAFAAVFGFSGAIISLLISKPMAKWSTKAKVITEPRNEQEQWLFNTVDDLAKKASIGTPEIAIFPSNTPNAFATGCNKNKALVAVSQGLLQQMSRNEVRAVIGHEIGHVANGDMITLSLIQGVINTFVIFFARVAAYFVNKVILKNNESTGPGFYITAIIFDIVFGILASVIVMWFSRRREFRADEAGANLTSPQDMISALKSLQRVYEQPTNLPETVAAFGISGEGKQAKWSNLLRSHPPLEDRIKHLEQGQY